MTRNLSTEAKAAAGSSALIEPWSWLLEIEVPTSPATRFRFTDQRSQVAYGFNPLTETENIYYPAGFAISEITEDGDGSLPSIDVTVGNASRHTRQQMEDYDGLTDQPAALRLVNLGMLQDTNAAVVFKGQVVESEVSTEGVVFRISLRLPLGKFPGRRYVAYHCRHAFGRGGCPYPIAHASAAFTTCPKTFEACEARGADMLTLGFPDLLPLRFGAFPGIRRGVRQ